MTGTFEEFGPLEVLHVSNHVICIAKRAGIPTVPDDSQDTSVLDLTKAWIAAEFQKPGDVFLGVVQRLDRPVSGVLAFGRTSKGAARLTESFRDRVAEKTYVAVTTRALRNEDSSTTISEGNPEGIVEHWLQKDGAKNVVRVVPEGTPGAKFARTRYRVIATRGGQSLVHLTPETGRSHQLRVAMASLGAPLVGDLKYGAPEALFDRSVALHALALRVPHPTQPEPVTVSTMPPKDPRLPWATFRRGVESLLQELSSNVSQRPLDGPK